MSLYDSNNGTNVETSNVINETKSDGVNLHLSYITFSVITTVFKFLLPKIVL